MSSIPRFFVSPETFFAESASVILPPDAAHHARSVLRLRSGEPIFLHDGQGFIYKALLEEVSHGDVTARIESRTESITEPRTRITIAQALPKTPEKIEQVLQHGTEVGASGFLFFAARRSVARLAEGEKVEKRLARWRGIIQGAAEQSGRGILPDVGWIGQTRDLASSLSEYDSALILHESAAQPLATALSHLPPTSARLIAIVGPEGGLDSSEEVPLLERAGGIAVTLGPRILRTETAALVALAQILFARN